MIDYSKYLDYLIHFLFGAAISSAVNGLIMGLFLIGLLILLKDWFVIKREKNCLKRVRNIFQNADKEKLTDLYQTLDDADLPGKCITVQTIKDLKQIRELDGNVESMADPERTYKALLSSWPRYIANMLIIIGLIGTILGLSRAVLNMREILLGMGAVVDRNAFQKVISDILGSLGFMETAFSTTLCGFFLFLAISFFDHFCQRKESFFIKEFERFKISILIPFFRPVQVEDSLNSIAHVLKSTASDIIGLTTSVTDMVSAVNTNQETYGQLAKTLHTAVDHVGQAQRELNSQYTKMGDVTDGILHVARGFTVENRRNQTAVEQLFQKLGSDKSEIEKLYIMVDQSMIRFEDTFKNWMELVSGKFLVAADFQNQQIKRIEEDHDTFLKNTYERMNKLIHMTEQVIGDRNESQKQFLGEITNSHLNHIKALGVSQDVLIKKLDNGFEKIETRMNEFTKTFHVQFKRIMVELAQFLESRFQTTFSKYGELFEGIETSQKKIRDTFEQILKDMKTTSENLLKMQMNATSEAIRSQKEYNARDMRRIVELHENNVQQFNKIQNDFNQTLSDGFEELENQLSGYQEAFINNFSNLIENVGSKTGHKLDHVSIEIGTLITGLVEQQKGFINTTVGYVDKMKDSMESIFEKQDDSFAGQIAEWNKTFVTFNRSIKRLDKMIQTHEVLLHKILDEDSLKRGEIIAKLRSYYDKMFKNREN